MQSCLEKRGIDERKAEIIKSDYNDNNQYSREHNDAISNSDAFGRGSKIIKGHSSWKPHKYSSENDVKNTIKYDNFDTLDETIGNCYDIEGRLDIGGRKKSINYSIYSSNYQYGKNLIGSTLKK